MPKSFLITKKKSKKTCKKKKLGENRDVTPKTGYSHIDDKYSSIPTHQLVNAPSPAYAAIPAPVNMHDISNIVQNTRPSMLEATQICKGYPSLENDDKSMLVGQYNHYHHVEVETLSVISESQHIDVLSESSDAHNQSPNTRDEHVNTVENYTNQTLHNTNQHADDSGYRTSSLYSPVSSCDMSGKSNDSRISCTVISDHSGALISPNLDTKALDSDNDVIIDPVAHTDESDIEDISVGDEGDTSFTCEVKYTVLDEENDSETVSANNIRYLDRVVKDSIEPKNGRFRLNPPLAPRENTPPLTTTRLTPPITNSLVYAPRNANLSNRHSGHIDSVLYKQWISPPPDVRQYHIPAHTKMNDPYFILNNMTNFQKGMYPIPPSVPYGSPYSMNVLPSQENQNEESRSRIFNSSPLIIKPMSPGIKTGYEFLPHLNVPVKNLHSPHTLLSNTRNTVEMHSESAASPLSPRSPEEHFSFNLDHPKYSCPDCNKSYSTFSGLTKHRQFHCTAQSRKEFSCKHCNKTYTSLGALKMHIRTHTLPCKCQICGKAFSRPWLLQGHIRTHTGEKPFSCQHCNRAFADRSNLRAHLQTHSEVKKYSCKHCTKTFSRMSLLMKHEDGGCSGI